MSNKSKNFFKGIKDTSPLMIPVIPFGIIFGVLAIDLGLTPLTTIAMSVIIFGGASQIIFLQLFSLLPDSNMFTRSSTLPRRIDPSAFMFPISDFNLVRVY